MIKAEITDHLLSDIIDLYNWHHVTKKQRVTYIMMHNWVGSYFANYKLKGNNETAYNFHRKVCTGRLRFQIFTKSIPFLELIVGHSLGCVLYSYQPIEIYARVREITRNMAADEISVQIHAGQPYKFIEIIEDHFTSKFGINEGDLNTLKKILGLNLTYQLPSDLDCDTITKEIINTYFHFQPAGIVRRIYTE